MTFMENWSLVGQLLFMLAPFVIGALGVAVGLYMALSRDLETMVQALRNSPYIVSRAWMAESGVLWRLHLVSVIGGMILFPKPGLKKGVMSVNDLRGFPVSLRRKQYLSVLLAGIGFAWLIAVWLFSGVSSK